jgi:hypothetical protein
MPCLLVMINDAPKDQITLTKKAVGFIEMPVTINQHDPSSRKT